MDEDIEASGRPPGGPDRERSAAVQAPLRIYLPFVDEASQLDELPAWRPRRTDASDIEYVRADLAAADAAMTASPLPRAARTIATAAAPASSALDRAPGAGAGESVVANWCAGWGDERPSRAAQRMMAEDIDRAIAAALEVKSAELQAMVAALEAKAAAGPPRRARTPRIAPAVDQLALELPAPEPAGRTTTEPAGRTTAQPAGRTTTEPAGRTPTQPAGRAAAGSDAQRFEPTVRAVEPAGGPAGRRPPGPASEAPRPDPQPRARGWTRSDAYLARLWSSANADVLAALARQHVGLDVTLRPEPTNEVDGEAVAIAVDLPEAVAGGFETADAPVMRVIGYIARAEARKEALFAALSGAGMPCRVRLHLEPDGWYVHIPRSPSPAGE